MPSIHQNITIGNVEAFKQLQQFAGAAKWAGVKDDTVMRTSGELSANKSLTISTGDRKLGLFHWKRSSSDQAANNATRAQFLKALMSSYGIQSAADLETTLPDSVKKELRLKDFGLVDGKVTSGKPLTARRIGRVMTELQKFSDTRAMGDRSKTMGDDERALRVKTSLKAQIDVFTKALFKPGISQDEAEKHVVDLCLKADNGKNPFVAYLSQKTNLPVNELKLNRLAGLLQYAVRSGETGKRTVQRNLDTALRWYFNRELGFQESETQGIVKYLRNTLARVISDVEITNPSDRSITDSLLGRCLAEDPANVPDWLKTNNDISASWDPTVVDNGEDGLDLF